MVAQHMTGPAIELGFIDKRKQSKVAGADPFSHQTTRYVLFTCNATGTTVTMIGANATPGTEVAATNVVRIGDTFRLFNAAGAVKEETVFRVTAVAVAGSTTVTYVPASAVAPVSTDFARLTGTDGLDDSDSLDQTLTKLASATYTASVLNSMTENDKVFAIRSILENGAL